MPLYFHPFFTNICISSSFSQSGFGAFFAGNAPEVFPDFVVEGIDFGGFGVSDDAIGGTVHFCAPFCVQADMAFKPRRRILC